VSEDSLEAMLVSLALNPQDEALRVRVVKGLLKARNWEAADFQAGPLRDSEHRPLALLAQARLAAQKGQFQESKLAYQKAIESDRSLIDEALEAELEGSVRVHATSAPGEASDEPNANIMRATFADIGGMDALKEKIRLSILYPLQKPEIYAAYGKKVGGGMLLYGPPGCGKTHLARATAGEIGANFYVMSLNEILNMWLGESEKALANLFATARKNSPAIIFIDEVDALGAKRSDIQSASIRSVVSQFLTEMDGIVSNNENLMVLGATNMPWNVDSALRRPGRFDRVLFVPPPDRPAREQILAIHTRKGKLDGAVNLSDLAGKTENFSGADLSHLVQLATERALSDAIRTGDLRNVTQQDFLAALKECQPSTLEWLRRAKNYVNFANQDGTYNDLDAYLQKARIR
jgi:transitional endoplasmic reticulum ATPase